VQTLFQRYDPGVVASHVPDATLADPGGITGMVLAVLVLLLARLFPWANALAWAEGLILLSRLLQAGWHYVFAFPGSYSLLVDKHLGLHDPWDGLGATRGVINPCWIATPGCIKAPERFSPATAISLRLHVRSCSR